MSMNLINTNNKYFPTPYTYGELTDYARGWNACLNSVLQQKPIGNNLVKEASHLLFMIGEVLVDESKGNYTSEVAIDKIRNLLCDNQETEKKLTKAVMEMDNNE